MRTTFCGSIEGVLVVGAAMLSLLFADQPPVPAPGVTFAVISDLHLSASADERPPRRARELIRAILAEHPQFVVITGDFTNGHEHESRARQHYRSHAWHTARALLQPLRDAGIGVLPIAGNHDTYLPGQRDEYAAAFADLADWAAPLAVSDAAGAPFQYAVDVDGVHLALTDLHDDQLRPEVAAWLSADLAGAEDARVRIVFAHVPFESIIAEPRARFRDPLAALLAAGGADLYVAGHEHTVWDEDVRLPDGSTLREILVGPGTGIYDFSPSVAARRRAGCVRAGTLLRCRMPHGGTPFTLRKNHFHHWIDAQRASFTMLTVAGTRVTSRVVAIGADGTSEPFGSP